MTSAAIKEPWRCKYCLRLNKQKALRCGTCDSVWQQCYDSYYVHNQNTQRQVAWNYTGWTEEEDESWNYATRSSKSPRRKTGKSPRRPKKNKENSTVPDFDPPWNAKGQPNAPTVTSTDSGAPSGQAEEQLQSLVSKLKEKEAPLSPEEVEHIIAETTTTTVTSKNLNQAARKLDQAREKFQGAQKERRNLHTKWSSYIEESVKRWKSFAEDFASKDAALEDKVQKAKEVMQTAKANLETIKELHSKQDEAFLGDVMEVPSGADEEAMKVESAEAIQQGIASMVSSLDAIRIKPADEENAEASVAKKPKLAHAGTGSASLQPFGKPSKYMRLALGISIVCAYMIASTNQRRSPPSGITASLKKNVF